MNDKFFYKNILKKDKNRGFVKTYKVENVTHCTESLNYPNIRFKSFETKEIINPIFEKTMSLSKIESFFMDKIIDFEYSKNIEFPVFFFCFNFNNYYHFLYDTLPYLISYKELKKKIPNLKLLIPNINFKKFVTETFEMLEITSEEFVVVNKNYMYSELFFSDSMTHGINSNLPPHISSKNLYKKLILKSTKENKNKNFPKKIYISRRTWENKDLSNIGTNYTDRRQMLNEMNLITYLQSLGYTEIFCEHLSMSEKITLFNKSDYIIGAIGGGMSNCIFSNKNTTIYTIVSPDFLNVNQRFIYSMDNGKLNLFKKTYHNSKNKFKNFQRVYVENRKIVGEIVDIENDNLKLKFTNTFVSGWDFDADYEYIYVHKNECIILDNGLNSPFSVDLDKFKKFVNI